jgi:hypothetical protein
MMSADKVFFSQNKAAAPTILILLQKIEQLGYELIDHLLYCPDLVPSNYYLFLKQKNESEKFSSNEIKINLVHITDVFSLNTST